MEALKRLVITLDILLSESKDFGATKKTIKGKRIVEHTELSVRLNTNRKTNNVSSVHLLIKNATSGKLKVRIDNRKNHKRPHLHIDFNGQIHAASFAIDDGDKLVGDIPPWLRKIITVWIILNQEVLRNIWNEIQNGTSPEQLQSNLSDIKL